MTVKEAIRAQAEDAQQMRGTDEIRDEVAHTSPEAPAAQARGNQE
ncbi:hypothetical protein ABZ136_19015 [Streptomyces microflavus]